MVDFSLLCFVFFIGFVFSLVFCLFSFFSSYCACMVERLFGCEVGVVRVVALGKEALSESDGSTTMMAAPPPTSTALVIANPDQKTKTID